jgi:hypothetical protein
MKKSIVGLAILGISLISNQVNADAVMYENKYSDEVPYIDLYSYSEFGKAEKPNARMVQIWESSPEIKNEVYFTSPHTIIKENGKVKYALAHVRGAGYSFPGEDFEDLVLINCQNPRNSYIERGDRERISLRDSMAIGGKDGPGLGDSGWTDHIPRKAVGVLFKTYCK